MYDLLNYFGPGNFSGLPDHYYPDYGGSTEYLVASGHRITANFEP